MGWIGCYSAIAYCDYCRKDVEVAAQVETGEECRQVLRDEGWKFLKDGTMKCPDCVAKGQVELLSEESREGSEWQLRWPKYERRN